MVELVLKASIINYFIILSALGIGVVGIREIAKNKGDKGELQKTFSQLFTINTILDEKQNSSSRQYLLIEGEAVTAEKVDDLTVKIDKAGRRSGKSK